MFSLSFRLATFHPPPPTHYPVTIRLVKSKYYNPFCIPLSLCVCACVRLWIRNRRRYNIIYSGPNVSVFKVWTLTCILYCCIDRVGGVFYYKTLDTWHVCIYIILWRQIIALFVSAHWPDSYICYSTRVYIPIIQCGLCYVF